MTKESKDIEPKQLLPKRLVDYIHKIGVRALDHLAETLEPAPADAATPDALHALVERWKTMEPPEKEQLVDRIAESVVTVIAASATLPRGLELGKKAAKDARKVVKRQTKKLKRAAAERAKARKKRAKEKALEEAKAKEMKAKGVTKAKGKKTTA